MFDHPDTAWTVVTMDHNRRIARAQRHARLGLFPSGRGGGVTAWVRALCTRCGWGRGRTAMPRPARRGRAPALLSPRDGRPETAMRLRRARNHERVPHHRAVKRWAARL